MSLQHIVLFAYLAFFVGANGAPQSADTGVFPFVKMNPNFPLVSYKDNVYYYEAIMLTNKTYASAFCNYNNMQLLWIEDKAENDFLSNNLSSFLGGNIARFYTSGIRIQFGYMWETTGMRVNYTNWHAGQPDNMGGTEDCIEVRFWNTGDKQLTWNDISCGFLLYPLCKAKKDS